MAFTRTDDQCEQVTLVDEAGIECGAGGKLDVHATGALHAAFSIFLFSDDSRLLLQCRALSKYHSPGLWANTCCGHPRPGEAMAAAANRRLHEEFGLSSVLQRGPVVRYRASVGESLIENERVQFFFGMVTGSPTPNPFEIAEFRYCDMDARRLEFEASPAAHAAWSRHYMRYQFEASAAFAKPNAMAGASV